MLLHSRPLNAPHDFASILDFVQRFPDSSHHVVDLSYRLCSPAAQDSANGCVWLDDTDEMVGFCIVQRQFSTIDCVAHPADVSLKEEMMAWAMQRLNALAQETGSFGFLYDSPIENDPLALKHGFTRDDWEMRHLALSASSPIQFGAAPLPEGFQIRPLNGRAEMKAYVDLHRAAFQSRNMTVDWRERTLGHPLYQPELDLVIETNDGHLAAFCIGWLATVQGVLTAQIEPLGVLPDFHRMGLGHAILEENLRRMLARGAETILIDAENTNDGSQGLYEAVGFREVGRTLKYWRMI